MTWDDIIRYIARQDPALVAEFRPATEETIRAMQALTPTPLPQVYLEFLRTMGEGSGRYDPLTARYECRASKVIEREARFWPPEGRPTDRYLVVGYDIWHSPMQFPDLCIELGAPGYDVRLFSVEDDYDWEDDDARELEDTMMSLAAYRAFHVLDMDHRRNIGYVGVVAEHGTGQAVAEQYLPEFQALCERMPVEPVLQLGTQIQCYTGPYSLIFTPSGDYITIKIGAESEIEFLEVVEQLRDHMPPLPYLDVE